ncbi:MAG: hypothetical protein L0Y58_02385 [Verrucomicrobia subdivision 3 bacterium]|nr:hypothetical protein [Limisphaerales bacterium]
MTITQELILAARDAVGEGDSATDWKIVPTEHAVLLADKSASFAEVLRGARPKGIAKMYVELDALAVEARDTFKNTVTRANFAVFCTAGLGALLLIASGIQGTLGKFGLWVVGTIGLLGVVSGSLATMWLTQVKGGSLVNKWSKERAKAEAKRLAYFKAVINGVSDDPFDQLLAFEYTRRFLLDNQIDYFRDRGRQHERAHNSALKTSTQAVFVASTVTAGAGLLSMLAPQLATIAGIGVIASAYSTLALSRSSVNIDRRNADRYRLAKDQLEERKLEIDIYREKVASGDKGAVQEFFEPIFITLSTDHKVFLNFVEQREMAIGAMEGRLTVATDALQES